MLLQLACISFFFFFLLPIFFAHSFPFQPLLLIVSSLENIRSFCRNSHLQVFVYLACFFSYFPRLFSFHFNLCFSLCQAWKIYACFAEKTTFCMCSFILLALFIFASFYFPSSSASHGLECFRCTPCLQKYSPHCLNYLFLPYYFFDFFQILNLCLSVYKFLENLRVLCCHSHNACCSFISLCCFAKIKVRCAVEQTKATCKNTERRPRDTLLYIRCQWC